MASHRTFPPVGPCCVCRSLERRDDPGDLPDVDPGLAQHHPGPGIATVGPAVNADPLSFERREVTNSGAPLDEKAAMAECYHWEDRQADEMPVDACGVDHEPTERRLAASARGVVGDRPEPMVHVILEVDRLRDNLPGQQRRNVIPRIASKLQREACHGQTPSSV